MGNSAHSLLKKIDDGREGDVRTIKVVRKLFMSFDTDSSGKIDEGEYGKLVEEITKYVRNELGRDYEYEAIRSWVILWLDPDHTGIITFEALLEGIHTILNANGD
eukprot:TRINITY_DN67277_c5_g1_i1.p2 TRINITY_DN67277_c5_g1~~TRINITY_DN67277_c5_g1_i1.p2  ORF type:complete len:105 (+),score=8.26 TRINITY_DN67277_c5_g1_i1:37-351(+)